MTVEPTNRDVDHLRLLSVFQYILAALLGLGGCFPVVYLFLGVMMLTGRLPGLNQQQDVSMAMFGTMFMGFAALAMAIIWTQAFCMFLTGHYLSRRSHYMFCLVITSIECLFVPLGTILGVFTILVLDRDSVKTLFLREQGVVESDMNGEGP